MTKLNFFCDVDSSLKSIQHLGSSNPLVITSPKTFPNNHVTDSLELVNLLTGSTFFLCLTHIFLLNQLISKVLVVIKLVFSFFE